MTSIQPVECFEDGHITPKSCRQTWEMASPPLIFGGPFLAADLGIGGGGGFLVLDGVPSGPGPTEPPIDGGGGGEGPGGEDDYEPYEPPFDTGGGEDDVGGGEEPDPGGGSGLPSMPITGGGTSGTVTGGTVAGEG